MGTKNAEVLAEIQRLEHEITRIGRELDVLRRRVDGGSSSRTGRTQAFTAPPPAPPPVPTFTTEQPPAPSSARTTHTRNTRTHAIDANAETIPPSAPVEVPPSPSTARRAAQPSVRLDDEPTSSVPPAPRSKTESTREHGRYEFVSEAKQRVAKRG